MWDFPSASSTLCLTACHEFSQVRVFCSSGNVTIMKVATRNVGQIHMMETETSSVARVMLKIWPVIDRRCYL